jgi:hypothetical protein
MGHHCSTDLAKSHPQLDLTDVYAFESDLLDKTCLVLIVNPKSQAGNPNNFSSEALYKFHLGADKLHGSRVTYTVRIQEGSASVGLLGHAGDSLGQAGTEVGWALLNLTVSLISASR